MPRPHKTKGNRATEFSNDLANFLTGKGKPRKRFGGLLWRRNWPLPNKETIDVVGLKGDKPIVLIEAELLREDPASNVVKIWKWAVRKKLQEPCLFVQSFAKSYRGAKRARFDRAQFVAKRMTKEVSNLTYKAVRLAYNPRPGGKVGAGRRRHHARNLAFSVIRLWNAFESQRLDHRTRP